MIHIVEFYYLKILISFLQYSTPRKVAPLTRKALIERRQNPRNTSYRGYYPAQAGAELCQKIKISQISPVHENRRSFKTMHAGSMSLVGMERWLNSDQFKKKESLKRSKIDRFRAKFFRLELKFFAAGIKLFSAGIKFFSAGFN